ncbi:DUF1796 family putative cysteine peptidase [Paenibacillus sp. MMS20-IR301]|uniref:DUF1796 family putative cysteine peptidase n=1 Tax=Paenibacillus sp. MMS20-IR301 TaxID=2895946 RepID=UPI0028E280BB|nr:DUF1796 family putative cysteine peptidase [Paenibacillus sp. MMS20-IR301]WNS45403.1 DUF1796 family putative cysteine peptidase [Paenibacillus sp. MMS20-IR301]
MKLLEVKQGYRLIVSLGFSCAPAINLKRYGLRKFSMPLDWMISYSLTDVNRLLRSRFQQFMEFRNLHKLDETDFLLDDGDPVYLDNLRSDLSHAYFIKDASYNIISVHDFPVIPGQDWTAGYPAYRLKLERRTRRFWSQLMSSSDTLFVRWFADADQVRELQLILTALLKNKNFTILILNPVPGLSTTREVEWGIQNVCVLEVSPDLNDYANWDYILQGISLY